MEYLKAIQMQDDWLRWETTAEADEVWNSMAQTPSVFTVTSDGKRASGKSYVNDVRPMYRRPLLYGECYYVAPHIVRNLARLSATLPLRAFSEDLLISRFGFALLAAPIFIAHAPWPSKIRSLKVGNDHQIGVASETGEEYNVAADTEIAIDAIGWMPADRGVQFVGYQKLAMIDFHNAAMVKKIKTMFPDPKSIRDIADQDPDRKIRIRLSQDDLLAMSGRVIERPGFYPITHFNVRFGETWQDVSADFENLKSPSDPPPSISGVVEEHIDIETKFTFALFEFMNDRRVVVRRNRLPRSFRRHAPKREAPLTDVNVILLRAEEEHGYNEKTGMPEPRDWDWQWDVREHMRYNRKTQKKDIHVSAYRKGPPDKPLKPRGRDIFVVAK